MAILGQNHAPREPCVFFCLAQLECAASDEHEACLCLSQDFERWTPEPPGYARRSGLIVTKSSGSIKLGIARWP
ncbi:hypothetical protein C1J02_08155 [Sulfitobacter sp. SK011]|nr:hypothetical protein C1J02_08155 [Sulfitobacter sp. SK011]